MTHKIVALTPEHPLSSAREIFLGKKVHHLPIVEGKKLVGLITAHDLFKLGKSAAEYANMKCSEIMTTKIATLSPEDHLGSAAMVLMEHLFHAVPIVNDDHELIGIVTTYDLLKYEYMKEYPEDLGKFVAENMV